MGGERGLNGQRLTSVPGSLAILTRAISQFSRTQFPWIFKVFIPAHPVSLQSKQASWFGSSEQERHSHSETPHRRLTCTSPKTITPGALSTWDTERWRCRQKKQAVLLWLAVQDAGGASDIPDVTVRLPAWQ